jgi:curli biogenesis system outer membrane secretion channel CsgG
MRRLVLTAFAAAALLSAGLVGGHAAAATTSAAPAAAAASQPLVRQASIVCGGTGCNAVHTKSQKKRKFKPLGNG